MNSLLNIRFECIWAFASKSRYLHSSLSKTNWKKKNNLIIINVIVIRWWSKVAWFFDIRLIIVDGSATNLSAVSVKTSLFLLIKHGAWRANEYVIARARTNMINITPIVVVVHYLLRLLLASKLGRKLAGNVISIEHQCSIGFWFWSEHQLWWRTVRWVQEV